MWTEDKIHDYLKKNINESRYIHTLGVVETAKKLAKINGEDEEKAKIAALIHDMAKCMPKDKQFEILKNNNVEIDKYLLNSPQILHGAVGAILARDIMKIEDTEILDAVKYHTTGKENMSVLEKIIYIADYIEPNRKYEEVERIRDAAFKDLDEGVFMGIENTMLHLIKGKQLIHINTINARNYLLLEIKNKQDK